MVPVAEIGVLLARRVAEEAEAVKVAVEKGKCEAAEEMRRRRGGQAEDHGRRQKAARV